MSSNGKKALHVATTAKRHSTSQRFRDGIASSKTVKSFDKPSAI